MEETLTSDTVNFWYTVFKVCGGDDDKSGPTDYSGDLLTARAQ